MTQDEILMEIREIAVATNQLTKLNLPTTQLVALVKLAIDREREACAKVCDSLNYNIEPNPEDCAEAIRARGQV
jgi:hypothetical protein